MSSNQSYQLPDLLGIIGSLELRTNRHCRFATEASEGWLQTTSTATTTTSSGHKILSANELSYLPSTKIGLLCALCFPTCDAPQLRVLTDFVTLLFYSVLREKNIGSSSESDDGMLPESDVQAQITSGYVCETPSSGFDLLLKHDLLRDIIDRRILALASTAPESWNIRFKQSVSDFQAAHLRLHSHNQHENTSNIVPSLEEYTSIARELYGANMVLDLSELMEVFQFPDLQGRHAELITQLKHAALDVIAWSTDVVSYQHSKIRGNPYNLITVLMHHNGLSVQGAMNLSSAMIKQAFSSFCSAERSIVDSLDKHKPSPLRSPVLSWVWNWKALTSSASSDPPPSEESEAISENTKRYIRALKDCIVGIVHWVYETELFFGKKGGEIRTFGWVFTDQIPVIPD